MKTHNGNINTPQVSISNTSWTASCQSIGQKHQLRNVKGNLQPTESRFYSPSVLTECVSNHHHHHSFNALSGFTGLLLIENGERIGQEH